jgi:hypothetical protein
MRRGLVPVDRLLCAAPLVAQALHYDVRRGHHRQALHNLIRWHSTVLAFNSTAHCRHQSD